MTGSRQNAVQLDRAIDLLLRGSSAARDGDESELLATARLLRDTLPRLHPCFSFEESLSARLGAVWRLKDTERSPEPIAIKRAASIAPGPDDEATPVPAGSVRIRHRRGLVAGGAIASGVSLALPIAGAALVVWRRSRSSGGLL